MNNDLLLGLILLIGVILMNRKLLFSRTSRNKES